jgi:hypothetical protein
MAKVDVSSAEYKAANLNPNYAGEDFTGNNKNNARMAARIAAGKKKPAPASAPAPASTEPPPQQPSAPEANEGQGKGAETATDLSITGGKAPAGSPVPAKQTPAWKPNA